MQAGDPRKQSTGNQQQQAGRDAGENRLFTEPVNEDQQQDDKRHGRRFERLQHRVHRQQEQAKTGQARQQHGTRDHLADAFPQEGTAREDHRFHKAPHQANLNREIRIAGLLVNRH